MLAVQGYFEAGRFVSSEKRRIPERRNVIVVVPHANAQENDNAEVWHKFLDAIQSIDEPCPVDFERASLHREVDV